VRHVTSVTKSNAQRFGMVLWDEVLERVARDYPGVFTDRCLVDAMAARMVLEPESLSVVVASNLHADILSDLGSALSGSLGLGCSANLNPQRRAPSMFEPVHGSAPNIAGKGIANPIGAVASAAMLLDHLGYATEAEGISGAIRSTVADGVITPDLAGSSTSAEFRDQLVGRIGHAQKL
jgi:tartrate dehydrogenase/decarboxylase/D-malate dehydrogenase